MYITKFDERRNKVEERRMRSRRVNTESEGSEGLQRERERERRF